MVYDLPELGFKVTSLLQFSCFFDDGIPEFGITSCIKQGTVPISRIISAKNTRAWVSMEVNGLDWQCCLAGSS